MAHVRETPFNEQRMLATAIMTNACKVAVIDHYAHRILEHDDLFQGFAAKMLAQALLENLAQSPNKAGDDKESQMRAYYIGCIANRLISQGVLRATDVDCVHAKKRGTKFYESFIKT